MRILIVTPAGTGDIAGNGVTAQRWAQIARDLGHQAVIRDRFEPTRDDPDVLLALHAGKSEASVRAFHSTHATRPIVVALTGTDLYPSLAETGVDPFVLEVASRLVVLQRAALDQLPPHLIGRTDVIEQSAPPITGDRQTGEHFQVAVLSHLREVKDPLLTAEAVRLLPVELAVGVVHVGAAYDADLARRAEHENATNPRYRWRGPVPRHEALHLLATSQLLVLSSRHEGGANVVSEALAANVPILASRIPGSVGLLGNEYGGYFTAGSAAGLARLLHRAATEPAYLEQLRRQCVTCRSLIDPDRERLAWRTLFAKFTAALSS